MIGRQSACRNDAVNVRVKFELLVPGMQHAEEADLGAETARGARDFEQGFGAGTKQQVVDELLVLQREWRQFMWQREDHMHVARRQKFPAARGEPLVPRVGLALGAVSVSARNGELTITCLMGSNF